LIFDLKEGITTGANLDDLKVVLYGLILDGKKDYDNISPKDESLVLFKKFDSLT
jgi:hypothetical protein